MSGVQIRISRKFEKQYRKLPQAIKDFAKQKEAIFRENPFDPRLETHKLHNKEKETWAFSVNRSYRIIFIFLAVKHVLFLEIGMHDIYPVSYTHLTLPTTPYV